MYTLTTIISPLRHLLLLAFTFTTVTFVLLGPEYRQGFDERVRLRCKSLDPDDHSWHIKATRSGAPPTRHGLTIVSHIT
ncbi:hypothetical protein BDN67DRAFT_973646 [Paxillus ammoniavirescens]|nr:hypothetical protein BDN67DRAFT_973646 [Paxillus ammoniavirescens]